MRELCYHQNPKDDNDECWGIDPIKSSAKHAREYECPHGDCNWRFHQEWDDIFPESRVIQFVVGFEDGDSILTIKCPKCQRFMWVHSKERKYFPSTPLEDWLEKIRPNCPNWPKANQP